MRQRFMVSLVAALVLAAAVPVGAQAQNRPARVGGKPNIEPVLVPFITHWAATRSGADVPTLAISNDTSGNAENNRFMYSAKTLPLSGPPVVGSV